MTNRTSYIDTRKRKSYLQKPLFEEDDVIPSKEPTVLPDAERRDTPCEECKKPIVYSSNDLRPGIICPGCGHGQSNPNLKGRNWP